ncbi:MAG: MFS transporter [Proteobacteria bacterium]|nr:MFS transporter [Pseudomonadota bacterium]
MDVKKIIDYGPVTWLQIKVVAVCFTLTMLDGFDVLAISFTAPSISEEWGIGASMLGIVFSAGVVGITLGAMFIGPFADMVGRRVMILTSLIVISIAMAITGLVDSIWQLVTARIFTGLGIGSILVSLTSLVAEYFPLRHRNVAICFFAIGYPIGAILVGIIASWLIPEFGWRSVFYAGGLLSCVMIPVVLLFLPESLHFLIERQPRGALQKINRILIKLQRSELSEMPTVDGSKLVRPSVRTLLTVDRRNETIRLWLSFFVTFLAIYFLISWIPKIIVDAGLSLETGINAGIAINLGALFGVLVLGYMSDKKGLRSLIFWFLLCGAIAMIAFGFSPIIVGLLLILSFVIGFFVEGGFIGLYAVAARIYPTEIRTTGVGWAIGLGRIGGIIGPYLGGILIGLGWSTATNFLIIAIMLIVGAFAIYGIKSPELIVVNDSVNRADMRRV